MIHWQGQEAWLLTLRPIGDNRSVMLRAIDRMTPGEVSDFNRSLQMAMDGLRTKTDAITRHIIVISDGDPTPPTNALINQLVRNKVNVTSVFVATHDNDTVALNSMKTWPSGPRGDSIMCRTPRRCLEFTRKRRG